MALALALPPGVPPIAKPCANPMIPQENVFTLGTIRRFGRVARQIVQFPGAAPLPALPGAVAADPRCRFGAAAPGRRARASPADEPPGGGRRFRRLGRRRGRRPPVGGSPAARTHPGSRTLHQRPVPRVAADSRSGGNLAPSPSAPPALPGWPGCGWRASRLVVARSRSPTTCAAWRRPCGWPSTPPPPPSSPWRCSAPAGVHVGVGRGAGHRMGRQPLQLHGWQRRARRGDGRRAASAPTPWRPRAQGRRGCSPPRRRLGAALPGCQPAAGLDVHGRCRGGAARLARRCAGYAPGWRAGHWAAWFPAARVPAVPCRCDRRRSALRAWRRGGVGGAPQPLLPAPPPRRRGASGHARALRGGHAGMRAARAGCAVARPQAGWLVLAAAARCTRSASRHRLSCRQQQSARNVAMKAVNRTGVPGSRSPTTWRRPRSRGRRSTGCGCRLDATCPIAGRCWRRWRSSSRCRPRSS